MIYVYVIRDMGKNIREIQGTFLGAVDVCKQWGLRTKTKDGNVEELYCNGNGQQWGTITRIPVSPAP